MTNLPESKTPEQCYNGLLKAIKPYVSNKTKQPIVIRTMSNRLIIDYAVNEGIIDKDPDDFYTTSTYNEVSTEIQRDFAHFISWVKKETSAFSAPL